MRNSSGNSRLITPTFIAVHLLGLHLLFLYFEAPTQPKLKRAGILHVETTNTLSSSAQVHEAPVDAPPPTTRPGRLDFQGLTLEGDHFQAPVGNGWTARMTLDPWLQAYATRVLKRRDKIPFGAIVFVKVGTGEVLAMAEQYNPNQRVAPPITSESAPHMALRAVAPAASVYKIITAAGLLERGVSPHREHGYKKALRRLYAKDLEDLGPRPLRASLSDALAHSNNGLIARLTDKHLDAQDMQILSARFGFNRVLPFPLLIEASTAHVPRGRLERARMAAGFWHTRLTPLHGALIAAAVAGNGEMPTPRLVSALQDPHGRWIDAPDEAPIGRVVKPEIAAQLRAMMTQTVRSGTGRKAFKKWPKKLRHIEVAGKTGTLATGKIGAGPDEKPYTSYTWFVGFAPADNPEVAFAVMVGNGEKWWWKAVHVSYDVLSAYFKRQARLAEAD